MVMFSFWSLQHNYKHFENFEKQTKTAFKNIMTWMENLGGNQGKEELAGKPRELKMRQGIERTNFPFMVSF